MGDVVALRYVGGGRWIAGVPARDLSAAEVERFPEALTSPLYATPTDEKHEPAPLPQGEFLPEAEEE